MPTYKYICHARGCSSAGAAYSVELEELQDVTVCPVCGGEGRIYIEAASGVDEAISVEKHGKYSDGQPQDLGAYTEEHRVKAFLRG